MGAPAGPGCHLMAFTHLEDNLHSEDRGEPNVKIPEDLVAEQESVREGAEQGADLWVDPLPPGPEDPWVIGGGIGGPGPRG